MLGHRKLQISDYVGIMRRRRLTLLLPTVLLPLVAITCAKLLPPTYKSQTLVIVDQQSVPDEYVKPVVTQDLDSRLASMREQILSRSHVQPIVERYNLYGSKRMTLDERIDATRKDIVIRTILPEAGTGNHNSMPGFTISFTANDARTAQLVCGEITSLFTGENLHTRQEAAENTTDFLKSQLSQAKQNLDDQDAKMAQFERAHFGTLPTDEPQNATMLGSLNTQLQAANDALVHAEEQKSYQQSILNQLQPSSPGQAPAPAVDSVTLAEQQELQQLKVQEADLLTHYTPDYPDVVATRRRIAEVQKQLAAPHPPAAAGTVAAPTLTPQQQTSANQLRASARALDMDIQARKNHIAQIQAQIGTYQSRIQASPELQAQWKDLTRDYDTAQKFYDDLLAKMKQSTMATELELRQQGEQFRVLDEPNLPDAPSFPVLWQFLVGGLVGGLIIGFGLAALKEYRDTSLRTEFDVWTFTNLPTLAVVPFSRDYADVSPAVRIAWFRRLFRRKPAPQTVAESGA
jgi:polysaccharide chain length determinant protein (PEP-CTERM system associated)